MATDKTQVLIFNVVCDVNDWISIFVYGGNVIEGILKSESSGLVFVWCYGKDYAIKKSRIEAFGIRRPTKEEFDAYKLDFVAPFRDEK